MRLISPLVFYFISSLQLNACPLSGKVIKIADGDTITVLDSKRQQHKIRLAGIDAPERKQPYGKKSKRYLSSLVGRKTVCIDWHKKDRYGHSW